MDRKQLSADINAITMTRNKTETQDLSLAYYKFSDIVLVYVGNKNILSSNVF
jgi:hypothetical protein